MRGSGLLCTTDHELDGICATLKCKQSGTPFFTAFESKGRISGAHTPRIAVSLIFRCRFVRRAEGGPQVYRNKATDEEGDVRVYTPSTFPATCCQLQNWRRLALLHELCGSNEITTCLIVRNKSGVEAFSGLRYRRICAAANS